MVRKESTAIIVIAVAIVAISAAILIINSTDKPQEESEDPIKPDDPEPEPVYPEGIAFDSKTGILSSDDPQKWKITDELKPYYLRESVEYEGQNVHLEPGYYRVEVGKDQFFVTVEGSESRTASWTYKYKGDQHDIQITFDIDISELSKMTSVNRQWNSNDGNHMFYNLPRQVSVDNTIKAIESELSKRFAEIGGDPEDRQAYADFLVSFAQLSIKYPQIVSGHNEDYAYWGVDEYWAYPLETLYHMVGDCEDSSAVACSLFKAAGFKVAMVGLPGHVTAALSLESFKEIDEEEFGQINSLYKSFTVAEGHSVYDYECTGPTYYGVDTIKKQIPVGYMIKGNVDSIGKATMYWGIAGFYPVDD